MPDKISYPLQGSCNCGYIRYEITEPFIVQVACHCVQCQKHTQAAFSLTGMLKPGAFRLTHGKLKKWTKTADSGNQVDCWFCPECGNRIIHGNNDAPHGARLKLGTLDDTSIIQPQAHIWTRMKQDWYDLPEGVPAFELQPDISQYLPGR